MPQHRLDSRMRCTEASCQNRQLYSNFLKQQNLPRTNIELSCRCPSLARYDLSDELNKFIFRLSFSFLLVPQQYTQKQKKQNQQQQQHLIQNTIENRS